MKKPYESPELKELLFRTESIAAVGLPGWSDTDPELQALDEGELWVM